MSHGEVRPDRIVVGLDGLPVLTGVGVGAGDAAGDLDGVRSMLEELAGIALPATGREELIRVLRQIRDGAPETGGKLTDLVRRALVSLPRDPRVLEVRDAGWQVDEVVVDLGPDERSRGLLDRWGSEETSASDVTGTASAGRELDRQRLVLLARLAANPLGSAPPERFGPREEPVVEILPLLVDRPPDPMPIADGVPVAVQILGGTDLTDVTLTARPLELPAAPPVERTIPREDVESTSTASTPPSIEPPPAIELTRTAPATVRMVSVRVLVAAMAIAMLAGALLAIWLPFGG
jgi:hypothetical protein